MFREQAESRLSGALAAVHVAAEAYPDLRASRGFGRLQAQLAEVEDDIVGARRIFNSNVQRYNDLVQSVPAAAIARLAGFRGRQYFDVETSAERNVPSAAAGEPRTRAAAASRRLERAAPKARRRRAATPTRPAAFHMRRIAPRPRRRVRARAGSGRRGRGGRLAAARRS